MKTKTIGYQIKRQRHARMGAAPKTSVSSSEDITVVSAASRSARTAPSRQTSHPCIFKIQDFKVESRSTISTPTSLTRRPSVFVSPASKIASSRYGTSRTRTTSGVWMNAVKQIRLIRAQRTIRACSRRIRVKERVPELPWTLQENKHKLKMESMLDHSTKGR